MNDNTSNGLLIECRSCGIENRITNYVPSMRIMCSQCRERLIEIDINETHNEHVCAMCGLRMVLLKNTKFQPGESACACGSTDLTKLDSTDLADEAVTAGILFGPEEDDALLEDTDWLRSDPVEAHDDDYNDMFNQEPGGS